MDSESGMEHGGECATDGDVGTVSDVVEFPEKRLVLEYVRDTELKGLFQIIGRVQGQPPPCIPGPFQITENIIVEFASLIRDTPRAAYYRETVDPALLGRLGTFMPADGQGHFDPQQI
jgi:hypothetical protein